MAEYPIERQIILSTGEDFSALALAAVLQVAIQMQGGKVPGISRIAHDVLDVPAEGVAVCVMVNERELAAIDKIWQESLV